MKWIITKKALLIFTIALLIGCGSSENITKVQSSANFEHSQYINPQDFGYDLPIEEIEKNEPADSSFTPISVEGGMPQAFGEVIYPPEALNNDIKGRVILEIYVNKVGELTAYKVIQSPHKLLLKAAVEAVKKWDYLPATLNQTPVASFIHIPLNFQTYSQSVNVDQ